jgi:two-component system, chemotaxis family, protein-glutamate methylesterase/glutaminase
LRPPGLGHPDHKGSTQELIRTVKSMSEIKVVRRFNRILKEYPTQAKKLPALPPNKGYQLIVIGTSTGGPPVLHKILSLLPANFSVPVLIVQHITSGFTQGFVEWLGTASGFPVHIAQDGQTLLPGHADVAPENYHMGITRGPQIFLSNHAPENGLRPSVAYLFRTTANVLGSSAVGVLLTGMGKDGAKELLEMKEHGGLTIAQDEASSIVHGMPGEAIKLGGAMYTLSPEKIVTMLVEMVRKSNGFP